MLAKRRPNYMALFVFGIACLGIGVSCLPLGKKLGTISLGFVGLGLLLMTIGSMGQKRN